MLTCLKGNLGAKLFLYPTVRSLTFYKLNVVKIKLLRACGVKKGNIHTYGDIRNGVNYKSIWLLHVLI